MCLCVHPLDQQELSDLIPSNRLNAKPGLYFIPLRHEEHLETLPPKQRSALSVRGSRHGKKFSMQSHLAITRDDVHVCIMCCRAIMNFQVSISNGSKSPPLYKDHFYIKTTCFSRVKILLQQFCLESSQWNTQVHVLQ